MARQEELQRQETARRLAIEHYADLDSGIRVPEDAQVKRTGSIYLVRAWVVIDEDDVEMAS